MKSAYYDLVVVGSGFGGAIAAHRLAEAGMKVLLLERGGWPNRDDLDWNQREILLGQRYRSPSPLLVKQYRDQEYKPFYPRQTVGGMSVFYGGVSLRMRVQDLTRWPLSYAELEPHYSRVEKLLGVHGEADHQEERPRSEEYPFPPPPLAPPARRLYEAAVALGYKPGIIPLAINFSDPSRPRCVRCDTCDGFPCKIQAKNDLATIVRVAQGVGLELIPGVMVGRLEEEKGRILALECIEALSGRRFKVSGRVVILSAGTLNSPEILLRSGLERFENYRLIGRFLMRHCNAVVPAIFPFRTNPHQVFHKQIFLEDFYEDLRGKYGTATGIIQSVYTPAPEIIRHFAPWGVKRASGLAAGHIQNLMCIAEDDPCFDNRVSLSDRRDGYGLEILQVTHRYSRADYERLEYLAIRAKKILSKAGGWRLKILPMDSFSHAVGTLRMGSSPRESVLDKNCRFWGIDNLFVLDGSFMPASGGVNPSLTIAANASRVADYLIAHWDQG